MFVLETIMFSLYKYITNINIFFYLFHYMTLLQNGQNLLLFTQISKHLVW